jgi:endonuclease/exonuclease/phosphatase family metal-dependent hydrolase
MTGGQIRWTTIQLMLNAGYIDAHRILNGADPGFTFPTWDPQIRLDFAFTPAAFENRLQKSEVVRAVASDHFPLLTTTRSV